MLHIPYDVMPPITTISQTVASKCPIEIRQLSDTVSAKSEHYNLHKGHIHICLVYQIALYCASLCDIVSTV